MSRILRAFVGARIYDGREMHEDHALIVETDGAINLVPRQSLPEHAVIEVLDGGMVSPGFVDLQVNGGGGVMFNDDQSVNALRTIAEAHASLGTTAILPTLITDTPERTAAAIAAVEQAIAERVEGIVGIHLEGPHLSVARKGAHDPKLIRQMTDDDLTTVLRAAERLPNVMMTVAPETTTHAQIRKMAEAGVIVSLGHTDAGFETCMAAFDAGARCVTHLFNAMSQLGNREPGLVGAALARDEIYAGLIADGIHVHPASIRTALAARQDNTRVFLVTDAMATAGATIDGFRLNGRWVQRQEGRLTLQDGTLAGADLDMTQALSVMTGDVGESLQHAIARATSTPSELLRDDDPALAFRDNPEKLIHVPDDFSTPRYIDLRAEIETKRPA